MSRRPAAIIGLVAGLPMVFASTVHASQCLKYEPVVVSLHGKLERMVFPGRPNYESITGGDEPEAYFYLRLPASICVGSADSDNSADEAKSGIRLVQLLLDEDGYKRLRPLLGHSVTVKGTLEGAMSGHHHAPVLLKVSQPSRVR